MSINNNSSRTQVAALCHLIFVAFVFCYVYTYQSDLLSLAQHVWSDGQTKFNPIVGALIITAVAVLLERLISFFFELPRLVKALTFMPSLLLLGTLSSVRLTENGGVAFGVWPVVTGVLLVAYLFVAKILANLAPLQRPVFRTHIFSKLSWCNILILVVEMLIAVGIGNNDAELHQRLRAEKLVNSHQYELALEDNITSSPSLTMLRALALAKTGELGERFFEYAPEGGSRALLPQKDGSVSFLMGDGGDVWHVLGLIPAQNGAYVTADGIDARKFLHRVASDSLRATRPAVRDYLLCAYLLDRDLHGFAKQVKRFYCDGVSQDSLGIVFDGLPRHYKEALILYTHTCSNRVLSYKDAVIDADYKDFYTLMRKETTDATQGRKPSVFTRRDPKARFTTLQEIFAGTYWLYYYRK